jgi:hypothetical protein
VPVEREFGLNGGAENPPGVPGDSSLSVYIKEA